MSKTKKICVYTCITGDYDDLHEVEIVEKNVDYLCFTNNKNLKSNTWKIIYIEDDRLDNHRLSRKIKMLGDPYISENYEISVWMDASVVFNKKVSDFVKTYLKKNSFAAFKHHARDCIYDEAMECIRLQKDKKESVLKHIEFLKKEKYPKNNGLCEMTVFIKKHNDPVVKKTMELWFDMLCKYSKRDQLSFMYCVWKTKMKIDFIDLKVFDNEWFTWIKHSFATKISNYRIYFGNDSIYNVDYDIQGAYAKKEKKYIIDVTIPTTTDQLKIELTKVPCIMYKNLNILGVSDENIIVKNSIKYYDNDVFYNDNPIIEVTGEFVKDEKFHLEIEFEIMNLNQIYRFTEYLAKENQELTNCFVTSKKNNVELKKELESFTNSKLCKFIRNFSKRKK